METDRTPTRVDVARHAGVSKAVVSYVLNEGPRPVAAETKARVLAAVEALGYRPNILARALTTKRTQTIGLLVPDISNPYFAELSRAIEDEAFARGYALLLANSSNDPARHRAQLATLRDRQVDGLLLVGAPDEELAGIPHVTLDRANGNSGASVVVDNRGGARMGVKHLLGHGYRSIAMLAGPPEVASSVERVLGWTEAMEGAAVDPNGSVLVHGEFSRESGYLTTRKLLETSARPDAIFAASDLQAIGAIRAITELRLSAPKDIALMSFDGTLESEFTTPPLSVVKQPGAEIAAAAMDLLLDRAAPATHRVVPPTLVLRTSCGCE